MPPFACAEDYLIWMGQTYGDFMRALDRGEIVMIAPNGHLYGADPMGVNIDSLLK